MAAIPEEFVFRGILQTRLERVIGRIPAITISVVLFTAWHLPTRYLLSQRIEGKGGELVSVLTGTGIPVLIFGLIFGLLWDRHRNLLTLIALHWGVDTLPVMTSLFGVQH
jgi:membrane protease YdiL (CAAX protease family)